MSVSGVYRQRQVMYRTVGKPPPDALRNTQARHTNLVPHPLRRIVALQRPPALTGLFTQPLDIANWWCPEEAAVLARELRLALVANAMSSNARIDLLCQHDAARLLQPKLLLELKRAHCRDGFEVARAAMTHSCAPRAPGLHSQWFAVMRLQPVDGARNAQAMAIRRHHLRKSPTFRTKRCAEHDSCIATPGSPQIPHCTHFPVCK